MKKVLLAGATGYLGGFIAKELSERGFEVTLVVRNRQKLEEMGISAAHIIEGDLRDETTYETAFSDVDAVISTVGITRQKDNLSYMDVDYGVNRLLLDAAERNGVKKFIYVSVLHGDQLRHLAICDAKERFVEALHVSPVDATVIRPSGFFSDMGEFYTMAKQGRVYLFGDGEVKANPIHGADLAKVCVDALHFSENELEVGGPEVLSHKEIAAEAFEAVEKTVKITYIPDWIRRALLKTLPWVMSKNAFGPVEFFLHVMAMNMSAPQYGSHTLKAHFEALSRQQQQ